VNGCEYNGVSAAITALYGRADSGWRNFTVQRDVLEVPLESIRDAYDVAETRHEKPVLDSIDEPGRDSAHGVAVSSPGAEISPS
jgi:hypothetical protein